MKTKISAVDKIRLQNALDINAEMEVLLIRLLPELKKFIKDDSYFSLRTLKRLLTC
ncbi:hypothetical protein Xsto_03898 [Xenorhabdus stockiae]|uniref:Uncharacterized protein n=1 Tax=Xenorhabdus stockiae TaxID=351614 RepID=A0A2D0KAS9_9GAMM|nr:hypothetical protein Xsto_03898 [Xenorhabdus stockiae]